MATKHLATIIKLPSRLTIVPKQPTILHSPPITHHLFSSQPIQNIHHHYHHSDS